MSKIILVVKIFGMLNNWTRKTLLTKLNNPPWPRKYYIFNVFFHYKFLFVSLTIRGYSFDTFSASPRCSKRIVKYFPIQTLKLLWGILVSIELFKPYCQTLSNSNIKVTLIHFCSSNHRVWSNIIQFKH